MDKLIIELEKVKNMLETIDHDEATVRQLRDAAYLCNAINDFVDSGELPVLDKFVDVTEQVKDEGWL